MNVLVSVYACEPGQGSEPGVGWNWIKQIARYHQVWAITRSNNREAIEKALDKNPVDNVHFYYADLPYCMRFWKKGRRGIHLYYYMWQIHIYFIVRKLHRIINFDLVHHITFVSVRFPCFLAFLPIPMVWGPVGGGEIIPALFYKELGRRGRFFESIRKISLLFTRVGPFVRITQHRAKLILVTNRDTWHAISPAYQNKTHIFPSVGFTREEICRPDFETKTTAQRCMILACVGELIPQKAHGLVIKALARLPEDQKAELWIIGDGLELRRLQNICKAYNLDGRIRFFGKISRAAVFHMLNSIDIFLFPGLKDSGGIAILEAMFLEKPVICLNLGGPGEIVTDQCGIKVKANTPGQAVNDFALAIKRLAGDPKLRRKMGKACRRRVEEVFDWEKKGFEMMKFYDEVRKRPAKEIYPGN